MKNQVIAARLFFLEGEQGNGERDCIIHVWDR